MHIGAVSEQFFYQQVLRRWGNLAPIRLEPAADLQELYLLGLPDGEGGEGDAEGGGGKLVASSAAREAARLASETLCEKAEMLREYVETTVDLSLSRQGWLMPAGALSHRYVGLEIVDGQLAALPQLIDDYVPPLNGLPRFVRMLAEEVWTGPICNHIRSHIRNHIRNHMRNHILAEHRWTGRRSNPASTGWPGSLPACTA